MSMNLILTLHLEAHKMMEDLHTIKDREGSSGDESALDSVSSSRGINDGKISSSSLKYTGAPIEHPEVGVPRNISSQDTSGERTLPRRGWHDNNAGAAAPPLLNIEQSKASSLSELHQRQRQRLYDSMGHSDALRNGHGAGSEGELPPLYRAETQQGGGIGFMTNNRMSGLAPASIGMMPNVGIGQSYGAERAANPALRAPSLLQQQRFFNSGLTGNYADPRTALLNPAASSQLYMQNPNRLNPGNLPMAMRYASLGNAANFNNSAYSNMAGGGIAPQQMYSMHSVPPSLAMGGLRQQGGIASTRSDLAAALNSEESALASALAARTSREQMELAAASMPHATQNYLRSSSSASSAGGLPPRNPASNLSALGIPAPHSQGASQDPRIIQQRFAADGRTGLDTVEFNQMLGTPVSGFSSMRYGGTIPNASGFAAAASTSTAPENPKRETASSDGSTGKPKRRRRVVKRFEERFKDLVAFKGRYGHCDVPHKWKEDLSLGKWCSNIRISYKHLCRGLKPAINLKPDQIEKLNDIGFKWKVKKCFKSFDGHFEDLMQFKSKFGHCDVPWDYNEDPSLGAWCCGIRKAYNQIQDGKSYASINKYLQLTEERVKKLDEAGFTWVFSS